MKTISKRPAGRLGFSLVWLGQIIFVLASGMTIFAFTIYMYQQTHSATAWAWCIGKLACLAGAGKLISAED